MSFYRQIQKLSQRLFTTLIESTLIFNSETFILTKLGSISSTEIVLKINGSCEQHKATRYIHVFLLNEDFTPHKPHFGVRICARPRVTRNTKLDYSSNCHSLSNSTLFAADKRHAWPRPLHNHIARNSLRLGEEAAETKWHAINYYQCVEIHSFLSILL